MFWVMQLLFTQAPIQEGHDLRAGAGIIGAEPGLRSAIGEKTLCIVRLLTLV